MHSSIVHWGGGAQCLFSLGEMEEVKGAYAHVKTELHTALRCLHTSAHTFFFFKKKFSISAFGWMTECGS